MVKAKFSLHYGYVWFYYYARLCRCERGVSIYAFRKPIVCAKTANFELIRLMPKRKKYWTSEYSLNRAWWRRFTRLYRVSLEKHAKRKTRERTQANDRAPTPQIYSTDSFTQWWARSMEVARVLHYKQSICVILCPILSSLRSLLKCSLSKNLASDDASSAADSHVMRLNLYILFHFFRISGFSRFSAETPISIFCSTYTLRVLLFLLVRSSIHPCDNSIEL